MKYLSTRGDPTRRSFSEILLEGLYTSGADIPTYCGIVTAGWKYVVYSPPTKDPTLVTGPEESELYDLRNDIGEKNDVSAANPDVVKQLLAFAEKCRAELGDSLTKRVGQGAREPGRVAGAAAPEKKKKKNAE